MRLKPILLILALIAALDPVPASAQKILYTSEDAATLYKINRENNGADSLNVAQTTNVKTFYGIFKEYGNYKEINGDILLKENPFITKEMLINEKPLKAKTKDSIKINSTQELLTGGLSEVVVTGASSTSASSPTWQTAVLDGTAKFLAQRFKEELAAYYINTLGKKIEDKPIVKTLFPKTTAFLKTFANQVYNTDIATFQAAAEDDIKGLPANLISSLQYVDALKNDSLFKSGLSLCFDLYKDFNSGISIADILNTLPYKTYLSGDFKGYLSILRILSNSLVTSDMGSNEGPWENVKSIDLLDFEDMQTSYYYALLYEELKNVTIGGKSVRTILGGNTNHWISWFHSFQDFYVKLNGFNSYLVQQKTLSRTKAPDLWETLFKGADIFSSMVALVDNVPDSLIKLPVTVRKIADNAEMALSIIKKARDKQYDQVIPNVIILLSNFDDNLNTGNIITSLRYASVMAQFANVKNAEDMKNLLESVALPIGSASIKRKSQWNVSFNGYVGVAAGSELAKDKNRSQQRVSVGITAPIGIAISKQYKSATDNQKKGIANFIPSGTLFISVFDIGNLVNVRLKSDTSSIGNVKFSDFLSLGASYFVNFKNSPFTFGVSWSYVPRYRSFLANNQWAYNSDVMRFRASLLIDIPIFNFYTKPVE